MRHAPRHGFTMIELILVLVVLMVLVTMAAPSFVDTLDKRRVINATQSLSAQILQARSLAVTRNRNVSLVVDTGEEGGTWCFGVTDGVSVEGVPPDFGEAPECNCWQTDVAQDDACTVSFPIVFTGDEEEGEEPGVERSLIRADGAAFPGVALQTLVLAGADPIMLTFEPTRGLANGDANAEFRSPRGRETRVAVNRMGRISTCSPSEETLLGGIKPCD
jgi:type IV fimbrial biogenesis protein FimT